MEPLRCAKPPAWEIPAAMAGDLLLIRSTGLLVWAGAVTVWSAGFAFALSISAEEDHPGGPPPQAFAVHEDERDDHTWLEVRFPDGRGCAADLNDSTWSGGSENLCAEFLYGESSDSRWWVSPLPPPGPVELTVHVNGRAGPVGTGTLDGQAPLDAAAAVEVAW